MILIRKKFTFEAAHQLEGAYTAACHECVHGHSYTVEVMLAAMVLDQDCMVVDFGKLKEFKDAVMERWDHGLILHKDKQKHYQPLIDAGVLKASKVSFLRQNPTAEIMAKMLFYQLVEFSVSKGWDVRGVQVYRVRVHETSTGWAEYGEGKP